MNSEEKTLALFETRVRQLIIQFSALKEENRQLYDETETVFFTTSEQYSYLSSSLVKEVAKFGGKIDGLIPDYAIMKMKQKLSRGE